MIFYQATLPEISLDLVEECILKKATNITPLHALLPGEPDLNSLGDYLEIVEQKRQTLSSPYKHSFLCLELECPSYFDTDILAPITTRVSDTINDAFENDLFILSFVYKNTGERFHALVILSNIERSLENPSLKELPSTYLHELIRIALPQYEIGALYQNALYLFSNKDNNIAYDGIFHVSCDLKPKSSE